MKTPNFWQNSGVMSQLLAPFSKLYQWFSAYDLAQKEARAKQLPRPVIVIGNINAGGTGKTPATIALTEALMARGIKVGILTRGYGRKEKQLIIANENSTSDEIGDEPLLIHQKTDAKMAVFHDRYQAGMALLETYPDIELFVCDDALQHRQLSRDIEIIVVGQQLFGNGKLLPAGPLREPISRLESADYLLANNIKGEARTKLSALTNTKIVDLKATLGDAYNLKSGEVRQLKQFNCHELHAAAGIAHPENFFTMLRSAGINATWHPFPDHHNFTENDFANIHSPIFITEKDAVKCRDLPLYNLWVVPLLNEINSQFVATLEAQLLKN